MKKIFSYSTFASLVTISIIIVGFKRGDVPTVKTSGMIADWQRAKAYTQDYLNAANDEAITFKPTSEMRSFGQQMLHLADGNYGLMEFASGRKGPSGFFDLENKSEQYQAKEALTKVVLESYDYTIKLLQEMNDAKLNEKVKVFSYELTREAVFRKAFEHQTHHRGQTTVYLRLKGIKPPDERLF